MSRTIRKFPLIKEWWGWGHGWHYSIAGSYHRNPKTQNIRRKEASAVQALRDENFPVPSRLQTRANPSSGAIKHAWDDICRSALREMDYANYYYFKVHK